MSKHAQHRHIHVGNDLHIQMGNPPVDADAARESCLIDAAADREWFRQHPHETRRVRPSSVLELKATGAPIGTVTVVRRGPCGEQARMFFPPDELHL